MISAAWSTGYVKNDPGNPEVCLVYDYHKALSDDATVKQIANECRAGSIGCFDCKKICANSIEKLLEPMRERRTKLDDDTVDDIIEIGNKKAKEEAAKTMEKANKAVFEISCEI